MRLAAVRAVARFSFHDVVQKLGSNGAMSEPQSILWNLADRLKDKRSVIHAESMRLLARLWGVAAGAIAGGHERVRRLLGAIPSRILEAAYVNDVDINLHIDLALFEALLPLGYPPMTPKQALHGGLPVDRSSRAAHDEAFFEAQLDRLRAERQLVLVRDLDDKAKKVFFASQANQASNAKFMEALLQACEVYNGGVTGAREHGMQAKLKGLIDHYATRLPNASRVRDDLWKFAKTHDRRSYQLVRFCMAPESDYRKVFKSMVRRCGSALQRCTAEGDMC